MTGTVGKTICLPLDLAPAAEQMAQAEGRTLSAVVQNAVRVAGPFTMEGVIALEDGPDSPIGGAPKELEMFEADDAG